MFLPPSLEWGLGDKACVLLRMVQNAPRRLPSCGSRCPGLRPEPPTPSAQSPGEWSNLLGIKSLGVGMTRGPEAKTHHQRAEGTLGPPPGPRKVWDRHRSHTHHPGGRTSRGQTHHRRHLGKTQKESRCEGDAQWHLWHCWIITN